MRRTSAFDFEEGLWRLHSPEDILPALDTIRAESNLLEAHIAESPEEKLSRPATLLSFTTQVAEFVKGNKQHLRICVTAARRCLKILLDHLPELSAEQLNVCINWHLGHQKSLYELTEQELRQARQTIDKRPHETALAYMDLAYCELLRNRYEESLDYCYQALSFEKDIMLTEDKPYSLRRLVILLRRGAVIMDKLTNAHNGTSLYARAYELAIGEADAPSQAARIRPVLRERGLLQ